MYSTRNEGKYVVVDRFIRTLKKKIYKYMTSISKNVYFNKLDDTVNKYNNTYHTTIKMKPVDVKNNAYIKIKKEVNDKGTKFKIGDHVRISKYKNVFAKSIHTELVRRSSFWLKKLNEFLEHFMKKNNKRQININLG